MPATKEGWKPTRWAKPKKARRHGIEHLNVVQQFNIIIKEENIQKLLKPHNLKFTREYTPGIFKKLGRKHRYDYSIPEIRLLIDIQGGTAHNLPSHTSMGRIAADAEKHDIANIHGYCVIIVERLLLQSGVAYDLLFEAILMQMKRYKYIN